jgi:hypothetical protein
MLLRLLYWLSLAVSLWAGFAALPARGDADFESVRTRQMKDRSGKGGDPKEKYFRESSVWHRVHAGRRTDRGRRRVGVSAATTVLGCRARTNPPMRSFHPHYDGR